MFQSNISFGRPALVLDAALDQLARIGLAKARDPQRLDVSQLPPPDLLVRLLTEIASVWKKQRGEPACPASAATPDIDFPPTEVQVFDSLGAPHTLDLNWTKVSGDNDTWNLVVGSSDPTVTIAPNTPDAYLAVRGVPYSSPEATLVSPNGIRYGRSGGDG